MERHIDEQTAQTQFKQVLNLAGNDQQSFVINRKGELPVFVLGIKEYLRLASPAPEWLEAMWKHSEENGLDTMTMEEIDAEIAECRREEAARLKHTAAVNYKASKDRRPPMESRIDEKTAKLQFSEIMDLAGQHDQRFTVSRPGGPTVVILSMQDYLRQTVPAPDWLERAWAGAKERGIDTMTMDEIDAEIAEYRREKAAALEQARR